MALNGLTHTFPDDIDVLLVSPSGTQLVLVSDVGGSLDISNVNLVLQDGAPALPDITILTSGTFAPTNIGAGDSFPAPAPAGTPAAALSTFNGPASAANGDWSLYVADDLTGDTDALAGGWALTFTSAAAPVSSIAIANATVVEGNGGTTTLNFAVTATPAPARTMWRSATRPSPSRPAR